MGRQTRRYTAEPLAEGVWAALHQEGGWGISNSAIVDLGGATLLFDTGLTTEGALELRELCSALTGRPPVYVINSHYHNDHMRGNDVFPEAQVLSGALTRRLVLERGPRDLETDRQNAPSRLTAYRALRDSRDPVERRAAAVFVPYWEAMLASTAQLRIRAPDLTCETQLALHGSRRHAVFSVLGAGHSPEDGVLDLPEDGIVCCGDLLFVDCHPFLGDGDPACWLNILDALLQSGAQVLVPGHGRVGSPASLGELQRYIEDLIQIADSSLSEGRPVVRAMPERYRSWDFGHPFFEANLKFLGERAEARQKETV